VAQTLTRKLYLVRHAEPERTDALLGRTDVALSAGGKLQASAALREMRSEIIYSSPLRRALETAARIPLLVPLEVLPELAEISYGKWDGKPWSEIEAKYGELAQRKLQDWYGITPPGGEEWSAFSQRVTRALEVILNGPFPAIVVAHAGVNAEIAHQMAGVEPTRFSQNYCQVLEYDI
jgi:alpha-ribazole phosphatase